MNPPRATPVKFEMAVALAVAAMTGIATVASSGVDTKYRLAAVLALAGLAALIALPERRIVCVVLWILIHPLGVEKIFIIDAVEGPQFTNPNIAINASDGPLLLLLIFLAAETAFNGRSAFRWSRPTTVLMLILVWSLISYAMHALYLDDGFTTSSPVALMQDVRLMVFVVLVQSAIRTRGEVIVALLAVAVAVFMQTIFVGISYSTGHLLSYAASSSGLGDAAAGLQTFSSSGASDLVRATGTVGQTNEQAMFHVFLTIPLIGFFVARNGIIRIASLMIVAGSALALVLTFSRGAWISFPFGLAFAGALAFRRRLMGRTAVLVGASFALGAAVAMIFLAQPIYERLVYGDTGATDSRLRMLRLASDLFQTSPLIGVGPGEFAEAALRIYPARFGVNEWILPGEKRPFPAPVIGRVDIVQLRMKDLEISRPLPVHNKYMLTLSEQGVPGLILWLWLFAAFARAAWLCSRSSDGILQMVGIGGVGVIAAEMLYMMVDLFHEDKPLEIMFFGPALVVAASHLVQSERARRQSMRRPGMPVASISHSAV